MANILGNLNRAIILALVLLAVVIFGFHGQSLGSTWANWLLRATHAWVGLLWIGLLYYFNFVQIPTMPKVPAELKPGVTKYIAPEALFWFRWAALGTVVLGLGIPSLSGYPVMSALGFAEGYRVIGTGMWMGIIMFINVWAFIWPAQKIALGIVEGTADEKAAAGKKAMLFSRTNFVLSFPMLYCMVTQQSGL
jgi:uncharacterized membrane protein